MRLVVVGLGSELMGDDSACLKVIDMLSKTSYRFVDFKKCCSTGFEIMESIEGYDSAIILDTICTGRFNKGDIVKIDPRQIQFSRRISSFHDFDLMTSIELGRSLGLKIPVDIEIYGIEIEDQIEFKEEISEEVHVAVKKLAEMISNQLEKIEILQDKGFKLTGGKTDG
ncbi:MAG: hydrogenase maturation protease [Deltaproteobacteria bacterium]|nr:hydrogenase maturation protease [Deltaproteobacteria bacterium]